MTAASDRARSVVAAGYMPLDVVVHGTHVRHSAGGTAGNVAAILAFLGWESALVGGVGEDAAAAALRSDLERAGVSTVHLRQARGSTARVVHKTGRRGHSYLFSCPSCGVRFPRNRRLPVSRAEELPRLLDPPDVFFFDRANPGTIRLAERLASLGSRITFEPASKIDTPYALKAFRLAHVLKSSASTGLNDLNALGSGREGQVQIVTSGHDGARYRVGTSKWRTSPAFEYPAVDEAGAGDWTTACFLHALPSEVPTPAGVGEALAWAQAVAAVSCGFVGARGLAHAHSRDSAFQSAQQLKRSTEGAKKRKTRTRHTGLRIHHADTLKLWRASARDACPTCLEPTDTGGNQRAADVKWVEHAPLQR